MGDYDPVYLPLSDDIAPWSDLDRKIELVYLEDGVTSIGEDAFSPLKRIQALYIPDSVTAIRSRACYWCEELAYVRCSKNLTEIGSYAFERTGIQSFSFPQGITRIENGVFLNSALTSVEIPDSVSEIGVSAFSGCELTSVTIPASVTFIGPAFVYSHLTTITFLGDAPEMEEDSYDGFLMGLEEGSTIRYSGDGFEEYIEDYPDYNWVKQ